MLYVVVVINLRTSCHCCSQSSYFQHNELVKFTYENNSLASFQALFSFTKKRMIFFLDSKETFPLLALSLSRSLHNYANNIKCYCLLPIELEFNNYYMAILLRFI